MHYGVLGMHWGVRKAKEYDRDLAYHRRHQRNYSDKQKYKSGKITKDEYRSRKKSNKQKYKDELKYIAKDKYSSLKPQKGKKASDIFSKSKSDAYKQIPHYGATRTVRNVMAALGGAAVGTYLAVGKAPVTRLVSAWLSTPTKYATATAWMTAPGYLWAAETYGETLLRDAAIRRIGLRGRKNSNIEHSEQYYNARFLDFKESDDYLEHFGILGMHWGKRNGPPYPLSDAKHDRVVDSADNGSDKSNDTKTPHGNNQISSNVEDYKYKITENDSEVLEDNHTEKHWSKEELNSSARDDLHEILKPKNFNEIKKQLSKKQYLLLKILAMGHGQPQAPSRKT